MDATVFYVSAEIIIYNLIFAIHMWFVWTVRSDICSPGGLKGRFLNVREGRRLYWTVVSVQVCVRLLFSYNLCCVKIHLHEICCGFINRAYSHQSLSPPAIKS